MQNKEVSVWLFTFFSIIACEVVFINILPSTYCLHYIIYELLPKIASLWYFSNSELSVFIKSEVLSVHNYSFQMTTSSYAKKRCVVLINHIILNYCKANQSIKIDWVMSVKFEIFKIRLLSFFSNFFSNGDKKKPSKTEPILKFKITKWHILEIVLAVEDWILQWEKG